MARQKRGKREQRINVTKEDRKMVQLSLTISRITLNINGSKHPILKAKFVRLDERARSNYMLSIRNLH